MKVLNGILLILLFACTPTSPTKNAKAKNSKEATGLTDNDTDKTSNTKTGTKTTEKVSKDTEAPPSTINPLAASAKIDSKIVLVPSDILKDPNIVFPQITLNITTADYLQVMRCAASYSMLTLQGQDMRTSPKLTMDDQKWGWSQALDDSSNCKIVSMYLLTPTYIDIPAPTGSFYYVANPCVSAAHSSTGQEGCSYQLTYTEPFLGYTNAYVEKIRDKSIELANAQSSFYARLDEVRITAKKLEWSLHMCEEYYAFKENEKALQRGLIMLGLNIAGAAAAGMFFGVQGAMMAGMLSQMLGSSIINDILNINPQINTCLMGEDSVSQSGATKEKDVERARINAQDFETKFNVKALLDRLTELLQPVDAAHPAGGLISQDLKRIEKVMGEMNKLSEQVLEVNTLIGSAKKSAEDKFSELNP